MTRKLVIEIGIKKKPAKFSLKNFFSSEYEYNKSDVIEKDDEDKNIFPYINQELTKAINNKLLNQYNEEFLLLPSITKTDKDYAKAHHQDANYNYQCEFKLKKMQRWFKKYGKKINSLSKDDYNDLKSLIDSIDSIISDKKIKAKNVMLKCTFFLD